MFRYTWNLMVARKPSSRAICTRCFHVSLHLYIEDSSHKLLCPQQYRNSSCPFKKFTMIYFPFMRFYSLSTFLLSWFVELLVNWAEEITFSMCWTQPISNQLSILLGLGVLLFYTCFLPLSSSLTLCVVVDLAIYSY